MAIVPTRAAPTTRRILVVDDEARIRRVVAGHLARRGFEVLEAGNAAEALVAAQRPAQPVDLVVTDVHMPGISGLELARLLLSRAPLKPVVVMTGDGDEKLARRVLSQGASGYLLKPFELFELDAVVDQVLSQLSLVEATEDVARREASRAGADAEIAVPPAWLRVADQYSGAGLGHGHRVARIATALALALPEPPAPAVLRVLEMAGRVHELSRIVSSGAAAEGLSARTAQILADLGLDAELVAAVRHMDEHWDGSGGPHGLAGNAIPVASRILAVAEATDRQAMLQMELGLSPAEAVDAAVQHAAMQSGALFDPAVSRALAEARETIVAIWSLLAAYLED